MRKVDARSRTGLAALSLALLVGGCGEAADEKTKGPPPPPEVGFVVLRSEAVPLAVELAGRTAAFETSEVRPQVSGVIRSRAFAEGSIVRAGQTLYQIDPSLYEAQAAEARAALRSAEATQNAARVRADRYRPLAQIEAVSQQEFTDVQATSQQAGAAVAQNRAALDTANINLRFTRVPAPITGRIGRSTFTTGALVTASQAAPLATIQRLDPIFVDIQQSSAALLQLRQSLAAGGSVPSRAQVRLTLENGTDYGYTGTLQFAEAVVDPGTGSVTLRASFPNPQNLLLPGMFVRARLVQQTVSDGILVPQQAVSRDPRGNATVFLVGPGNKAVQRSVTADRTVGDKWLVTAGLSVGDRVITEGLLRVRPNGAVRPVPAGSPPRRGPEAAGAKTAR
jgi:membrane fusion protein (multidrug efflux system)